MIGNKEIIAIEVGDKVQDSPDLFLFEIWFLGRHITCVDNIAYLGPVLVQAEHDILENRNLNQHAAYFSNMSPVEAHQFILSTRDPESPNWDIEDDTIYLNHCILNWGPNTDNVSCFLIPIKGVIYATLQFWDSESYKNEIFYSAIDVQQFNNVIKEFIKYGTNRI